MIRLTLQIFDKAADSIDKRRLSDKLNPDTHRCLFVSFVVIQIIKTVLLLICPSSLAGKKWCQIT